MLIKMKRNYKLSHKLTVSAIAAFLLSAVLFLLLQSLSHQFIHSYFSKPEVVSQYLKNKADQQQYIYLKNLSLSELSGIDEWIEMEELTEVSIYSDNLLIYNSKATYHGFSSEESISDSILSWENSYTMTFRDGKATAVIDDFIEHRYRDVAAYVNLFVFFLTFIIIVLLFIRKKVNYINVLEKEIQILEGGDLNYALTIQGNDELTSLAQEMDDMRKAFIAREQYAVRVQSSSNELMTAISHDLRTPLTALIGYLDVLEGENVPAVQSLFLKKCRARAYQIKSMMDNLFEYCFVSANVNEQLQMNVCMSDRELKDMITDHLSLLSQDGFTVDNKVTLPASKLRTNGSLMQHVFDNLLSNLRQHADPAVPIIIEGFMEDQELVIIVSNRILSETEGLQSTGLGLKICQKILSAHHGQFIHQQQENIFTVQLHLPVL